MFQHHSEAWSSETTVGDQGYTVGGGGSFGAFSFSGSGLLARV